MEEEEEEEEELTLQGEVEHLLGHNPIARISHTTGLNISSVEKPNCVDCGY